MFEMSVEADGVVRVSGRLDASESDRALEKLRALEGPMTLDCSALEYISSAGLRVVLMIHKRLHAAGHSFRLVNLQPMVRNVITYAGLHRLLNID